MDNLCNICSGNKIRYLYQLKKYDLYKCLSCNFVFVRDIDKESIKDFYEKEYFDGNRARFSAGFIGDDIAEEKKWVIKKYLDKKEYKAILEIGPGRSGGMIKYFADNKDKRVECVEISKYASEYLMNNKIKTFNGQIFDFTSTGKFDLIIATEVIEHEPDPARFIKSVYSLLNNNGLFFLSTGNMGSLRAQFNGKEWYYMDPPAHVSYFNKDNIRQVLINSGFKDVSVCTVGLKWIKVLSKARLEFLLPVISRLNVATGMLIFAYKKH